METQAPAVAPASKLAAFRIDVIVGAPVTVSVTLIACDTAPVAEIVTLPLYVPGTRSTGLTVIVIVEGAVPDAGVTVSHAAFETAVQARVPLPVWPR
jgi:hypothetical protein